MILKYQLIVYLKKTTKEKRIANLFSRIKKEAKIRIRLKEKSVKYKIFIIGRKSSKHFNLTFNKIEKNSKTD